MLIFDLQSSDSRLVSWWSLTSDQSCRQSLNLISDIWASAIKTNSVLRLRLSDLMNVKLTNNQECKVDLVVLRRTRQTSAERNESVKSWRAERRAVAATLAPSPSLLCWQRWSRKWENGRKSWRSLSASSCSPSVERRHSQLASTATLLTPALSFTVWQSGWPQDGTDPLQSRTSSHLQ